MTPEEAVEAVVKYLGPWLESAEKGEYDGPTMRRTILAIEHLDTFTNPNRLAALIERARHDPDVDAMLCKSGAGFVSRMAENIPPLLRDYLVERLNALAKATGGKRGKHPYVNLARDFVIVYWVARAAEWGFDPLRNRARHDEPPDSGCSIVREALKRLKRYMEETSVEEIWRRRSQLPTYLRDIARDGSWPAVPN